ncbi:MAG TPA: DUF2019 domain-containing protein [Archangium sp.]|uniref:DUF2019 domain-containing protein n=1 Tax=Archangium sp. TaxID=1872627 RepID=UPI002E301803|nr:DUF2019 domain-containing protein [Archangium sp.]HEX5751477.1 DUF2019 domain-containing protein [Archangium sp.]
MKRVSGEAHDDVGSLIDKYIELAKLHGVALSEFDHKKANRLHSRIMQVHRDLLVLGPNTRSRLLELLEHPDMSVRSWAASQSLDFAPERAEPVLERIAAEGPLPLNLNAETVLMGWRSRSSS